MAGHQVCKDCGADWFLGEVCACDQVPQEKPLFLPLNKEHYLAFRDGDKDTEYRLLGRGWNEQTCRPGRRITLSCGYGKQDRMAGRIRSFAVISFYELSTRWRKAVRECYGRRAGRASIAAIGIDPL